QFGKYKVLEVKDCKLNTTTNLETGKVTESGLPNSNVLYYKLENDAWCCVRPSGTEPKIKFYIGIKANTEEQAEKDLQDLSEFLNFAK
ncbi:alpha-phosphoglucomutase, partial [human gut metagenome]